METFPTTGLRVSTCSEPETVAAPPARLVTLTSKGTGPSRSVAAQDPTGTLKISADVAGQTAKVELASGASWQEPKASFATAARSTAPLLAGNPLGGAACTVTWTVSAGPWKTPSAAAAAAKPPRSSKGMEVEGAREEEFPAESCARMVTSTGPPAFKPTRRGMLNVQRPAENVPWKLSPPTVATGAKSPVVTRFGSSMIAETTTSGASGASSGPRNQPRPPASRRSGAESTRASRTPGGALSTWMTCSATPTFPTLSATVI